MKRSSFLKSLLGIAVAPMAIAKVMEKFDDRPKMISGEKYFNTHFAKSRRLGRNHIYLKKHF